MKTLLNLPKKAFCIHCHKYRKVFYGKRTACINYKDAYLEYEEIIGFCTGCNENIAAPGVWDENLKRVQEKYNGIRRDVSDTFSTKE